jgi:hypothetical protein
MDDDEFHAHVTRQSALAMGSWLTEANLLHRVVKSLSVTDLESLATAAVSTFIAEQSKRLREKPEAGDRYSLLEIGL